MKYKGFTYSQEKDYEPDCIKIFHTVITPEGKQVSMDWSSYSTPSQNDFELWVDIGLPDRMHPALGDRRVFSPLNRDDLFKIKMDVMSLLIMGV
jgi:hypothetical protein